MKALTPLFITSSLVLASNAVLAEPDFERINKDVTVMSNIIKGAFESEEECRGCNPRIKASYLINQGAVFNIRLNSWHSFKISDHDLGSYSFVVPGAPTVEEVEISEVVEEVLDNFGAVMEDVGERIEMKLGDFEAEQIFIQQDSETRRALRDLNRERRELEYQRREHEIEMIHADEEQRRKIEKRIAGLEKQVSQVEEKQAKLSKAFEAEREERERLRMVKVKKAKQQAEERQQAVENIVLQSLCDYGATLKNIPDNEHVSLVFEQHNSDVEQIIVMEMKDVQGCSRTELLRSDGIRYEF